MSSNTFKFIVASLGCTMAGGHRISLGDGVVAKGRAIEVPFDGSQNADASDGGGTSGRRSVAGWSIGTACDLKMVHMAQVMQTYLSSAMSNRQIAWDAYLGGLMQRLTGRVLRWLSL